MQVFVVIVEVAGHAEITRVDVGQNAKRRSLIDESERERLLSESHWHSIERTLLLLRDYSTGV
jgi:hypothetical protein